MLLLSGKETNDRHRDDLIVSDAMGSTTGRSRSVVAQIISVLRELLIGLWLRRRKRRRLRLVHRRCRLGLVCLLSSEEEHRECPFTSSETVIEGTVPLKALAMEQSRTC